MTAERSRAGLFYRFPTVMVDNRCHASTAVAGRVAPTAAARPAHATTGLRCVRWGSLRDRRDLAATPRPRRLDALRCVRDLHGARQHLRRRQPVTPKASPAGGWPPEGRACLLPQGFLTMASSRADGGAPRPGISRCLAGGAPGDSRVSCLGA